MPFDATVNLIFQWKTRPQSTPLKWLISHDCRQHPVEVGNGVISKSLIVFRNSQYKEVGRSTIEILQRTHNFKVNCCLEVHNVYLKFALPILDKLLYKRFVKFCSGENLCFHRIKIRGLHNLFIIGIHYNILKPWDVFIVSRRCSMNWSYFWNVVW